MLRLPRAKQIYLEENTGATLRANRGRFGYSDESEYLESLIRKEYEERYPEEVYKKKEEAAQNIFSAVSDLQKILSKETLKNEERIKDSLKWLKKDTKKIQEYSQKSE